MENEKILKIVESSHFNFLIGSGASRNYLETLQNIEGLLTDLDNESKENKTEEWYKLLEVSIKFWYYDKCIRGNSKLIDKDFELHGNKLSEFQETNQNYIKFLQALNILVLKRRNKLLPKEVNLFTTNMDLFLDINLDNLGLEFNDGFSGKFTQTFNTANYQKSFFKNSSQYNVSSELPLFNLYKLHGSLTWDKSYPNEIRYNANVSVLAALNNIVFPEKYLVELVSIKGTGSAKKWITRTFEDLKKEAKDIADLIGLDSNIETFATEYDKLVMINPTKEKFENTTLRLEYYEQMRMYSNILERENSVLFVTGFSFADEHIRQITYRALNSNPTLLVVVYNYSEEGRKSVESFFPKLKYKNLYTDLVGYDFKKVTEEVFLKLAEQFDAVLAKMNENEAVIKVAKKDGK